MTRLTRADIVARAATKTKDIAVAEWAVGDEEAPTVTIKAWSIADRDEILQQLRHRLEGVEVSTLAPQVCAVSLVDQNGQLMFGSEEGVAELKAMSHEGLLRVMNAAYHFNGLGFFATDEEGQKLRDEANAKAEEATKEDEAEVSPN